MKRLLMGILLFSLWLWAFAQEIDTTPSKGIDQNVIIAPSPELDSSDVK